MLSKHFLAHTTAFVCAATCSNSQYYISRSITLSPLIYAFWLHQSLSFCPSESSILRRSNIPCHTGFFITGP